MWRALLIACLSATPLAAQDFFTIKGHGGPIVDIAVSPSGQVATASFDNSVGLWKEKRAEWFEGHRATVNTVHFFSEDWLAPAGDDNTLWLWSLDSGEGTKIATHTAKIVDIARAPDGKTVAIASWDATIGLTEMSDHGTSLDEKRLKGHKSGVNAVAFSNDGETLYSASVDGTIRARPYNEANPRSIVIVKHGFGVNELVINDAERWLAYGATDGGTRIIDLETRTQIADFTLDRRPILAMAYDPNADHLAAGDGQGYIMVIDTKQMRITHDFQASRTGPIWALAFSQNGQNLLAGGIEDIVYSWPLATMREHEPMPGKALSFQEKPETLTNGERQFKRKCSICHTLTQGSARKAGPSLHGLFGRRAGMIADYTYSDTLEGSEIVWSAETIDALFDLGPDHYIPSTKMPMQRIVKQTDRNDLIDYLRAQTAQKED